MKCIVSVDAEVTRRYLGCYLCFEYSFASYFVCITNFHFPFVDKMALKTAMVEFCRCLLKRPYEGDRSDSPGLVSFEELKFSPASGSSALEAPFLKKRKGKKMAKVKEAIQLDFKVPTTLEAKL